MLKPRDVPAFLHDVFGERQTLLEILLTVFTALLVVAGLLLQNPDVFQNIPLWRTILALLLMVDIVAGCVANFTRSTSNYYAARPGHRKVFIAVHVHLPVLAWLLGLDLQGPLVVWAYTIASVLLVNHLQGHRLQLFTAGVLTVLGMAGIVAFSGMPAAVLVIAVLFLVKVVFSFGVDHYQGAARKTP